MKDENSLELETHSEGLKMSLCPSSRGLPLIGGGRLRSCELLKGHQYVAGARVVIKHRLLSCSAARPLGSSQTAL